MHHYVTRSRLYRVLSKPSTVGLGPAPLPCVRVDAEIGELSLVIQFWLVIREPASARQSHVKPVVCSSEHDVVSLEYIPGSCHCCDRILFEVVPQLHDIRISFAPFELYFIGTEALYLNAFFARRFLQRTVAALKPQRQLASLAEESLVRVRLFHGKQEFEFQGQAVHLRSGELVHLSVRPEDIQLVFLTCEPCSYPPFDGRVIETQ